MRAVSRAVSAGWSCLVGSPRSSSSTGRPSGSTAFVFPISFITVAITSVGSIPRTLATGCCGRLFGMSGSSISNLAFSIEQKNHTHPSRVRPLPCSAFLPRHRRTVIRPSSSPQLHRFNVLEESLLVSHPQRLSNSTTWRSKKRTTAALRTLFSQLHSFLTALRSCAPLVPISRRCHAACIGSVAASSLDSGCASPSNLALVFFVPGVGSPIQQSA